MKDFVILANERLRWADFEVHEELYTAKGLPPRGGAQIERYLCIYLRRKWMLSVYILIKEYLH